MRTQARSLLGLHLLLALYSVTNIFSKLASEQDFLSWQFVLYYGCVLLILAIYAVGWQQAIKRMPLTTAYANKAVTVVWGIVFGVLIFGETITFGKLAGAALIVAGVVWFGIEDARCQAELESQMRADLASGLTDANGAPSSTNQSAGRADERANVSDIASARTPAQRPVTVESGRSSTAGTLPHDEPGARRTGESLRQCAGEDCLSTGFDRHSAEQSEGGETR